MRVAMHIHVRPGTLERAPLKMQTDKAIINAKTFCVCSFFFRSLISLLLDSFLKLNFFSENFAHTLEQVNILTLSYIII